MRRRLRRKFFTRGTLAVAKDLLGKYLVRKVGNKVLAGKIVETEVYIGPRDKASHAFGGKMTKRNIAEYMVGGHVYIYLVYGMYWQLNISTSKAGKPECVLIRALQPEKGLPASPAGLPAGEAGNVKLANGPGKLCRWLKLDKSFYGEDVAVSKRLWVEDRGVKIKRPEIGVSPRVGIDYAGSYWAAKPWRFFIKGNPAVSK